MLTLEIKKVNDDYAYLLTEDDELVAGGVVRPPSSISAPVGWKEVVGAILEDKA